jgi:hypothetical protein
MPARGAEHRVGDAGVARRRVEQDAIAVELALPLALENHRERGAVLDRSAGILRLELRVDLDAWPRLEAAQADEWRPADQARERRDVAGRCAGGAGTSRAMGSLRARAKTKRPGTWWAPGRCRRRAAAANSFYLSVLPRTAIPGP